MIDIEDEQVNAALVEVNSIDDAKLLIENTSMTGFPLSCGFIIWMCWNTRFGTSRAG